MANILCILLKSAKENSQMDNTKNREIVKCLQGERYCVIWQQVKDIEGSTNYRYHAISLHHFLQDTRTSELRQPCDILR
jgi:hypothetical protein